MGEAGSFETITADRQAAAKRRAALDGVALVRSGMVLGLGTGSTAWFAVEAIAAKLRDGSLANIVAVATSHATRTHAGSLGIPLTSLDRHPMVDLTIDGADEIDPHGNLIKGHGGALLWEKIVAAASRELVIVADATKLVRRLGTKRALPVEVVRFGWNTHEAVIRELGAVPVLRRHGDAPVRTDEGHYILDCTFSEGIADPARVDAVLCRRPGVVETGLFLDFSPRVLIGEAPEPGPTAP